VSDPYEAPVSPELRLSTVDTPPEEGARAIMAWIEARGFVLPAG
jgi:sulfate adenylyltransferase